MVQHLAVTDQQKYEKHFPDSAHSVGWVTGVCFNPDIVVLDDY